MFREVPVLSLVLQGMPASLTVKNGDVFSGIFAGAIMENQESAYLLKMVQHSKINARGEPNGVSDSVVEFIGTGEDFAMYFDIKEVVGIDVEGVAFDARPKGPNGESWPAVQKKIAEV